MSKKKQPDQDPEEIDEVASPPLSQLEQEISLICLRFFRGDWEQYLDYLGGPRVTEAQRRREIPLVERLRERDRRADYLTTFLEDEIFDAAETLPFEGLLRLWELAIVLDPALDPFPPEEERSGGEDDQPEAGDGRAPGSPPTVH